jgi:hypothetical protein
MERFNLKVWLTAAEGKEARWIRLAISLLCKRSPRTPWSLFCRWIWLLRFWSLLQLSESLTYCLTLRLTRSRSGARTPLWDPICWWSPFCRIRILCLPLAVEHWERVDKVVFCCFQVTARFWNHFDEFLEPQRLLSVGKTRNLNTIQRLLLLQGWTAFAQLRTNYFFAGTTLIVFRFHIAFSSTLKVNSNSSYLTARLLSVFNRATQAAQCHLLRIRRGAWVNTTGYQACWIRVLSSARDLHLTQVKRPWWQGAL